MTLTEEAKTIIKEMLLSGELISLSPRNWRSGGAGTTWYWESGHTRDVFYLSYWDDGQLKGWNVLSGDIMTEEGLSTPEEALNEYRRLVRSGETD